MTTFTTEDRLAMQSKTAYELADELDNFMSEVAKTPMFIDHANMLRQQADEIKSLKQRQNKMSDVIRNLEAQVYGGTTK